MPVTGAKAVNSKMKSIFKDIQSNKTNQFVSAVLSVGWNNSKLLAPTEYGTLINSITMWIEPKEGLITGSLSYNTNYAAYLEFGENWSPRPPALKSGPAWNPNAKPHFLRLGFESPESKAEIKELEKIFKV